MDADKIIELLGGNTAVANLCGISPQAVADWKLKGIPHYRLVYLGAELERLSHGLVSRRDICPDKWQLIWPELATKEGAI
jgi:DNA-binding transcriptional regulator YdaS (Cro superfamily)